MPIQIINQEKDSLTSFFTLTFLVTWGLGALAIFLPTQFQALFGDLTDTNPIYFLAVAAPTISATSLTFAQDGWHGLGALYAKLVRWRIGIQWYALVLAGFPVLGWLVSQVTGSSPLKNVDTHIQFLWLLFYLLISGPLGEELGWRGYALPRLLKRFSPLTASLILGAIWGVWHLPSFFLGEMVQASMSILIFLLNSLFLSIVVTWFFLHTGESVLIAVLVHYMVNICASILGVMLPAITAVMLVAAALVIAVDKQIGWHYPRKLVK
jgi:hypothetical protein